MKIVLEAVKGAERPDFPHELNHAWEGDIMNRHVRFPHAAHDEFHAF
jgi:hypothetical protein